MTSLADWKKENGTSTLLLDFANFSTIRAVTFFLNIHKAQRHGMTHGYSTFSLCPMLRHA